MVTLRAYTAWVSEADQRAAGEIATRMPPRPSKVALPERQEFEASNPYERIAAKVRDRIYGGDLAIGTAIPSIKQLAREYEVSVSTAQRAVRLLDEWGLVRVAIGRPTLVQPRVSPDPGVEVAAEALDVTVETLAVSQGQQPLELEVRRLGTTVATLQTNADPGVSRVLRRLSFWILVPDTRRRQDRIDRSRQPGPTTAEQAELAAARKRIRDLETELAVTQKTVEALEEEASPKGGTRRSR